MDSKMMRINEIFTSIEGEVSRWYQGGLSTFVRLQGCNLQCSYCDTEKSQDPEGGKEMSIDEIVQEVTQRKIPRVTITGGEPMLQWEECHGLVEKLIKEDYLVSIETNGTIPIPYLALRHRQVGWVIDFKLDYSDQIQLVNFRGLPSHNWVKFIIRHRDDYVAATKAVWHLREMNCRGRVAMSPSFGNNYVDKAGAVLEWMEEDREVLGNVFLNLQLHKIVGVK